MEEYLGKVWAGARSKPSAKTFGQLRLQVHSSVSAPIVIIKMPPHRLLNVDTSPRHFFVVQGVIASEGRRLDCCQCGWESYGGTLKPFKYLSSLSTNMLSMCKCSRMCVTMHCSCWKYVVMCVIYCHKLTCSKLSKSLLAKCGMESLVYVILLGRYILQVLIVINHLKSYNDVVIMLNIYSVMGVRYNELTIMFNSWFSILKKRTRYIRV